MDTRTYCEGCGTYRFKPAGERCWHCKTPAEQRAILAAKQQQEVAPAVSAAPIVFGGHQVNALGFTTEQFERAVCRALVDDLVIHPAVGYHLVTYRDVNGGYDVTRTSCNCSSGRDCVLS